MIRKESFLRMMNVWTLSALLGFCALAARAQNRYENRGYATDRFEGFEAFDIDERVPQKEKSFWFSVSKETPALQLVYARAEDAKGHLRGARKGFEALIREWPTSPEAPEAQMNLAQVYEKRQKYGRAFDEYQYLLLYYAGNCPYDTVLKKQFQIANLLLHDNRSMFGWALSGMDAVRERFETIVRNAPRSAMAPEIMLIIGGIRTSEKEIPEAIQVYDGLLNRYPNAPQAEPAAYLSAKCRYELGTKHRYNEEKCRDARSFLKAVLTRMPRHPQKEEMTQWLNEMTHLLEEQNYKSAVFYDTRQRKVEAAKAAYRRFLTEFRDSKYSESVRQRLAELEAGAPPARK